MVRRRPARFTTLAVFNFIVGGLSLLCGLTGFQRYTVTVNNVDVTPQFEAFMSRVAPIYPVYRSGSAVANVVLGFGFVASGVGLLVGWGRVPALVCGALSLLHQIAVVAVQLFVIGPAFSSFFAQVGPIAGFGNLLVMLVVAWAIMVGIYDIILISLMAVASAPPAPPDAYDDADEPPRRRYAEDEEDRPRRQPRDDDERFEEGRRRRGSDIYYEEEPPPRRRTADDLDDEGDLPRRPRD